MPRSFSKWTLLLLAATVFAGCAHVGQQVHRGILSEGTPEAAVILASLAENDSRIENFRAASSFTLESPDLDETKRFKYGTIAFRKPNDLYVVGKKHVGVTIVSVFRLTSVATEFLIEFPSSSDKPYYQFEGERFEGVPFSVSPSDIARELFLPETWADLRPRDVHVTDYSPAEQTVVMEIGPRHEPRRRLTVQGPPWDVVKNERLDEQGNIIAVTTYDGYEFMNGARFPTQVSAFFPTKDTRMTFSMRNVQINEDLKPEIFDIKGRALEAGIHF